MRAAHRAPLPCFVVWGSVGALKMMMMGEKGAKRTKETKQERNVEVLVRWQVSDNERSKYLILSHKNIKYPRFPRYARKCVSCSFFFDFSSPNELGLFHVSPQSHTLHARTGANTRRHDCVVFVCVGGGISGGKKKNLLPLSEPFKSRRETRASKKQQSSSPL